MGVFHVFLKCTNGTNSLKVSDVDGSRLKSRDLKIALV